jgi:hypothetical protein
MSLCMLSLKVQSMARLDLSHMVVMAIDDGQSLPCSSLQRANSPLTYCEMKRLTWFAFSHPTVLSDASLPLAVLIEEKVVLPAGRRRAGSRSGPRCEQQCSRFRSKVSNVYLQRWARVLPDDASRIQRQLSIRVCDHLHTLPICSPTGQRSGFETSLGRHGVSLDQKKGMVQ